VKCCRSLFALFAALSTPLVLYAQLDTVWLRRHDSGAQDEDLLSDMCVDGSGNVYLAGTGYSAAGAWDFVVRKYGPNGESLWTAVYDGPYHSDDSAAAMVVDSVGNVYVCGWSTDTLYATSAVTLKYSPAGVLLWTGRYSRAPGDNGALALCLDRAGHVVVTGYAADTLPANLDYCTISYSVSTGDTAWVRFYNRTPENDEDVSVSVCCDDSNNVYLTGFSYDDGTDYDMATIRYTPTGVRTWLKRFNNRPWTMDDYGTKACFDRATRTLLVGGTVYDDNQSYNYFTIKYRLTNGDSLWARAYNRYPADDDDILTSLTTDPAGNVYVTGTSYDLTADFDIATVRYDAASMQRWVARYDEELDDDGGVALVTDSLGNVLVVGYAYSAAFDWDIAVLKYDSLGSQRWAYLWDNAASSNEDLGGRVIPLRDGRIMVAGTSFDNISDYDLLVMKCREVSHDFAVALEGIPDSLWFTDTLRLLAVVRNLSVSPDSGWVRLTIQPSSYRDSIWVRLAPSGTDTAAFRDWVPDTVGPMLVTGWTSLPIDERRFNDTSRATVVVWDDTTGIAEQRQARAGLRVAVAPNPTRGRAVVHFQVQPGVGATLRLYDVSGAAVAAADRQVLAQSADGSGRLTLATERLAAGVYFVKLEQGRSETGCKVVVQR
jgi:hypothetical protein